MRPAGLMLGNAPSAATAIVGAIGRAVPSNVSATTIDGIAAR